MTLREIIEEVYMDGMIHCCKSTAKPNYKSSREALSEIKKLGVVGYRCSGNRGYWVGKISKEQCRKVCKEYGNKKCKSVLIIDMDKIEKGGE